MEAFAIDVSSRSKDIDEVTVWIYDSEDAAKNGVIRFWVKREGGQLGGRSFVLQQKNAIKLNNL